MDKRGFIKSLCAGAAALALGGYSKLRTKAYLARVRQGKDVLQRPPAARPEPEFLQRCIRCYQCAEVCPNHAIQVVQGSGDPATEGTPFIKPRKKACIACMRCTQVCPTGALKRVPSNDGPTIQANVKMGTAVVDKDICNSYNGFVCGICVNACPFKGDALRAEIWERPVVNAQSCIGCGLCEHICIHYPQAIRVKPKRV